MREKTAPTGAARLRARSAREHVRSYPAIADQINVNDRWSVPADEWPDWTNEPIEKLGLVLIDVSPELPDFATREGGAR